MRTASPGHGSGDAKFPHYITRTLTVLMLIALLGIATDIGLFMGGARGEGTGDTWATIPIGPILDEDGKAVEGAKVTIYATNRSFTGTTDRSGYAHIRLPSCVVGTDVSGTVEKKGYKAVTFVVGITSNGTKGTISPMVNEHGSSAPRDPTYLYAGIGLIAASVVLFFLSRRGSEREKV